MVDQTYSQITITPPTVTIPTNATQAFSAAAADQFGFPLPSQPAFTWSVPAAVRWMPRVCSRPEMFPAVHSKLLPNPATCPPPDSSRSRCLRGSPLRHRWADRPLRSPLMLAWPNPVSDTSGTVINVQFIADDNVLAELSVPPYSFVWTNPRRALSTLSSPWRMTTPVWSRNRPAWTYSSAPPRLAAPESVRLRGTISTGGSVFNLQWEDSRSGGMYQVQYSSNLVDWTTLPPLFLSTATNAVWSDDGSLTGNAPDRQATRYYRVLVPDATFSVPAGAAVSFLPAQSVDVSLEFRRWHHLHGPHPTHAYTVEGPHTITLTVTDAAGPHAVTENLGRGCTVPFVSHAWRAGRLAPESAVEHRPVADVHQSVACQLEPIG